MGSREQLLELFGSTPAKTHKGIEARSHYLTMPDGVEIAVDVLLPTRPDPGGPVPCVLILTRYWRSFEIRLGDPPPNRAPIGPREPRPDDLVPRGFAMIIVDARGSGASSGVSPHPWSAEELADYGEVASWAAKQPWCNGNVGAVGISYEGSTAALLASTGVDAVKGVVPQEIEFDVYTDIAFPGGIPNQAFMSAWSEGNRKLDSNQLPVWFPLPWYGKWIIKGVRPIDEDRKSKTQLAKALEAHTANTDIFSTISKVVCRDDPFGDTGSSIDDWCVFTHTAAIAASGIPLFVWGSWMDANTADSVIRAFHTLDNPQIGVIGAWSHEMTTHGSPFQRPKSKPDPTQPEQWELSTRFLEKVLRSKETIIGKKIFYYTLGAETWKQAETFPPPGIQMMSWYFQPRARLGHRGSRRRRCGRIPGRFRGNYGNPQPLAHRLGQTRHLFRSCEDRPSVVDLHIQTSRTGPGGHRVSRGPDPPFLDSR